MLKNLLIRLRENINIEIITLIILLFPVIGLDVTDLYGFIKLPLFSPSKIFRVLWLILLLSSASIIVFRKKYKFKFDKSMTLHYRLIVAYSIFAALSVLLHTPKDLVSWYFVFELWVCMFVIILLSNRISTRDLLSALHVNIWLALVVLCILQLVSPELVPFGKRLGGFVYSPNAISLLFVAGVIIFHKSTRPKYFMVLLSAVLLVLTKSRTGIIALLLYLFLNFIPHIRNLLKKKVAILTFIGISGLVILLVLVNYTDFVQNFILKFSRTGQLSDILTLNNRTKVFSLILKDFTDWALLGKGYVSGVREYLAKVFISWWVPPHTHNSYLELVLAQGILGALPMLYFLGRGFVQTIKVIFLFRDENQSIVPHAFIVFLIFISGLTMVVIGNKVSWITNTLVLSLLIIEKNFKKVTS